MGGTVDVRLMQMTPDERAADAVALVQRIQARLAAAQAIDADNVTDAEETEEEGEEATEDLDGMHTVESSDDDVEIPEADEDTRKEDVY